ncbi:MAG: hypothetical protein IJ710_05675 [Prevotella sp.]|nr:hypothetical protein [Prevotella sp.]
MKEYRIHSIHPYHAKFYPGIPLYFIQKYATKESVVLDPFCGSGTTLVETNLAGLEADGVDINFLSAKMSRAKTLKTDREKLEQYADYIRSSTDERDIHFPDHEYWLTTENYRKICRLLNGIQSIEDEDYRNVFEVLLSAIIKTVCNKRDTWNYGYIADNVLPNKPCLLDAERTFWKRYESYLEAVEELPADYENRARVFCCDVSDFRPDRQYDLVITSPPYPFAVDFARYNRLSYYLLGEDLDDAVNRETGARNKRNRRGCVEQFFSEMETIYQSIHRCTKSGGLLCMTIGDTKRKKSPILFTEWLTHLLNTWGWSIVESGTRQLSRQSMGQKRIPTENVLVLRKG